MLNILIISMDDLPKTDIEILQEVASDMLERFDKEIDMSLDKFTKSCKPYALYEMSDEFIVSMKKNVTGKANICVGFPFPIQVKPLTGYKNIESRGIVLQAHLRGKQIRQRQRDMLHGVSIINELREIDDVHALRGLCANVHNCTRSLLYFDPYSYIGDSVIGLYFADIFERKCASSDVIVFSRAHKHLRSLCHCLPRDHRVETATKGSVIVMPDMIDNQWAATIDTIASLGMKPSYIFIPGRNLVVINYPEERVAYHYNQDDPLLRNKNIEDYMVDCLVPFMELPDTLHLNFSLQRGKNYLINPFGSLENKTIPAAMVANVCKNLVDGDKAESLHIVGGFKEDGSHLAWIEDLLELLSHCDSVLSRIKIRYFDDLSQLVDEIKSEGIVTAMTSDTSISHILNRIGVPNITVYNESAWDSMSVQSMTSDSPLGFCRYRLAQFPTILGRSTRDAKLLPGILSDGLICLSSGDDAIRCGSDDVIAYGRDISAFLREGLFGDNWKTEHANLCQKYQDMKVRYNGTPLGWIFDSYSPYAMVEGIIDMPHDRIVHLVSSAWRISPVFKVYSEIGE